MAFCVCVLDGKGGRGRTSVPGLGVFDSLL